MKFSLTFTISCLLILALLFCGCSLENEVHIGVYSCAALSLEDESFAVAEVYPEGLELELLSYGQAWLSINGERIYGRWNLEGENFTLDINGKISEGQLKDGVCILRLSGSEIEHTLLRDGAVLSLPEPDEDEIEEIVSDRCLFWNGDWYGFWTIENATGEWLDQSAQSFDCFARFDISGDNTGTMLFWDELQSADEPIARIELIISDSAEDTVSGVAVSTGGFFYDSAVSETQWSVDPSIGSFDSTFVIDNAHYECESGSFDYSIMLRPWGRTWEDVEADNPDLLPYFYYDWYLPRLASGQTMPEVFEAPADTVIRNTWIENEDTTDT